MSGLRALVLAGRRGPDDPLARQRGASHRALLPVRGVPMLLRVVEVLEATPAVGGITVSIDTPAVLRSIPELASRIERDELSVHTSLTSPSRSVLDVLERRGGEPALVTTADHALLTPEMVQYFVGFESDADVHVGVVARSLVEARHPETTRTYLRLRGDGWSGANLFAFRTPRAKQAAAFWVRAERLRKRPWRLVGTFGPGTLWRYALRRLDLDASLERVSRAVGVRIRAVPLPFAEAAIDVDRAGDLELAERLLAAREAASPAATGAAPPPR